MGEAPSTAQAVIRPRSNLFSVSLEFELVPLIAALAQTMPNRAVRVIGAIEDGELLPHGFAEASHCKCEFRRYAPRCWTGVQ